MNELLCNWPSRYYPSIQIVSACPQHKYAEYRMGLHIDRIRSRQQPHKAFQEKSYRINYLASNRSFHSSKTGQFIKFGPSDNMYCLYSYMVHYMRNNCKFEPRHFEKTFLSYVTLHPWIFTNRLQNIGRTLNIPNIFRINRLDIFFLHKRIKETTTL